MFDPLTKKQKQVLDFISNFIKVNGYSPSLDEIRLGLKLKAVSTIHEHINKLKAKGYLVKEINQARGVDIRNESDQIGGIIKIPVMGIIKKSTLILSNKSDFFLCDSSLFEVKEGLFVVKIDDTSMVKEGFFKDDKIIIKKGKKPEGVCLISINSSNNVVIRKVFEDRFSVKLTSLNPEIKERVYKKVEVIGCLVSLIRNFSS